jgi:hypothetical protein
MAGEWRFRRTARQHERLLCISDMDIALTAAYHELSGQAYE